MGAQVVGERLPQGAGEGGPRHVEEQSFAGAEEVDVEHGEQFGRGQGARVGEEAAGEHFERQVAGGVGEPQPVEEVQRVDVVELLVDVGDADVEEGEGRDQVDAGEVAPVEAGAAGDEGERVPWRRGGQAREPVEGSVGVDERIVGQGDEPGESGVGAAQQGAQVVVLAEERVEAAAHGDGGAVGEHRVPPGEAAA